MGVDAHTTIVALVHVDVKLGLHLLAGLVGHKIPQQLKIIRLSVIFLSSMHKTFRTSTTKWGLLKSQILTY